MMIVLFVLVKCSTIWVQCKQSPAPPPILLLVVGVHNWSCEPERKFHCGVYGSKSDTSNG